MILGGTESRILTVVLEKDNSQYIKLTWDNNDIKFTFEVT